MHNEQPTAALGFKAFTKQSFKYYRYPDDHCIGQTTEAPAWFKPSYKEQPFKPFTPRVNYGDM